MTHKARMARQEAARLRGEAVPDAPKQAPKAVTVNLGSVR